MFPIDSLVFEFQLICRCKILSSWQGHVKPTCCLHIALTFTIGQADLNNIKPKLNVVFRKFNIKISLEFNWFRLGSNNWFLCGSWFLFSCLIMIPCSNIATCKNVYGVGLSTDRICTLKFWTGFTYLMVDFHLRAVQGYEFSKLIYDAEWATISFRRHPDLRSSNSTFSNILSLTTRLLVFFCKSCDRNKCEVWA